MKAIASTGFVVAFLTTGQDEYLGNRLIGFTQNWRRSDVSSAGAATDRSRQVEHERLNVQPRAAREFLWDWDLRRARLVGCNVVLVLGAAVSASSSFFTSSRE